MEPMRKYEKAAIRAASLMQSSGSSDAGKAWAQAVMELFPDRPAARKKSCPRFAFLGICEKGLLRGVPPSPYPDSVNKGYAVNAIRELQLKPELAANKKALWLKASGNIGLTHNQQMDVVVSLWNAKFIESGNS